MAKKKVRESACSFTVRPADLQGALLKLSKLLTKGEKGEQLVEPCILVIVPETAEWATADEPILELVAIGRMVTTIVPVPCREPVGPAQFMLPLTNLKAITPRACGDRVSIAFFPPDAENEKPNVEVRVNQGQVRAAGLAASTSRFPVPSSYFQGRPALPECRPAMVFDARDLAVAAGAADAAADSDLEGSNYAFGGLRLCLDPDAVDGAQTIRLVGLDGRRCHAARIAWSLEPDAVWEGEYPPMPMTLAGCVVPSIAWTVLRRVVAWLPPPDPTKPDAPKPTASVAYAIDGRLCVLKCGGVTILSRIMEGRTGEWTGIIPTTPPDAWWEFSGRDQFIRALSLAQTTTDDVVSTAVNLEVRGEDAMLWSEAPDVGHGTIDFGSIVDWDVEDSKLADVDVGFMPSFVIEALRAFTPQEDFRLEVHQEAGTVLLKSERLLCMVKTYSPTLTRDFHDAGFLDPEELISIRDRIDEQRARLAETEKFPIGA